MKAPIFMKFLSVFFLISQCCVEHGQILKNYGCNYEFV